MRTLLYSLVRPLAQRFGFDVVRSSRHTHELDVFGQEIYDLVKQYTMTSRERIMALVDAVVYLEGNQIKGSFVECGVWKGGSVMAMAHALNRLGCNDRNLFLYDTFDGMPEPQDVDITYFGNTASNTYQKKRNADGGSTWCASTIQEVKRNMAKTEYPSKMISYVAGKVEETIPATLPESIALLRLDTDWYESTKHELVHLFPRLIDGGLLILDDYGHWRGARRAVDEYFSENNFRIFLSRIDNTGRIAVKTNRC